MYPQLRRPILGADDVCLPPTPRCKHCYSIGCATMSGRSCGRKTASLQHSSKSSRTAIFLGDYRKTEGRGKAKLVYCCAFVCFAPQIRPWLSSTSPSAAAAAPAAAAATAPHPCSRPERRCRSWTPTRAGSPTSATGRRSGPPSATWPRSCCRYVLIVGGLHGWMQCTHGCMPVVRLIASSRLMGRGGGIWYFLLPGGRSGRRYAVCR